MKLHSVKRRLVFASVLLCLAVITVSAIWVYIGTRQAILEVNDEHFREINEKLLKLLLITHSPAGKDCDFDAEKVVGDSMKNEPTSQSYSYLLLDSNGKILAKSKNAPPEDLVQMRHLGFDNIKDPTHKGVWRGVTMRLTDPQTGLPMWLWFGEDMHLRAEVEEKIVIPAIVPLVISTPFLCLLLVLLTNYLFAPINRLEKEVSRKTITNLTPLSTKNVPRELYSFIERLNFLFHEVDAAWKREKRFNQDSAHELRTPLAVIMLNAENALQTTDLEQRAYHLEQIKRSIKRSERTIEQLLTLAKVDNGLLIDFSHTVDLISLLQEVVAELVPLALKQNQKIMLETEGQASEIQGNEIFLGCLFRNLIDNAIRYSGEGASICVDIREEDNSFQVSVTDNGRGMSQEEIERVFERFYRGSQAQSKVNGVGLGMAIVQRIVGLHQGDIDITSEDDSLAFVITLPKVRKG
ncbi:Sensor protein QseC [Marinomonas spartinae]|uniref:sensor histidine kinase n=1 Tax=Marinomonas spartinae TaxID=1792290 RepID=UPI000808B31B|nr:ATP-binding protein [Marinomonas spartinae]SBS34196.1 Sensor protein QseC [Marinomonas spartinae]